MATFFQANKLDFNTLFPTKESLLSISTKFNNCNLSISTNSFVGLMSLGAFPYKTNPFKGAFFFYKIKPQKTTFSDWWF